MDVPKAKLSDLAPDAAHLVAQCMIPVRLGRQMFATNFSCEHAARVGNIMRGLTRHQERYGQSAFACGNYPELTPKEVASAALNGFRTRRIHTR